MILLTFKIPIETNLAEIDQRLGTGKTQNNNNTKQFNKQIKGINHCYDIKCNSNNIIYDPNRDEVYCKDCGTVLRRAFDDYEDIIQNRYTYTPLTDETLTQPYNNRIDYYQDLMKQSETEVLGTI